MLHSCYSIWTSKLGPQNPLQSDFAFAFAFDQSKWALKRCASFIKQTFSPPKVCFSWNLTKSLVNKVSRDYVSVRYAPKKSLFKEIPFSLALSPVNVHNTVKWLWSQEGSFPNVTLLSSPAFEVWLTKQVLLRALLKVTKSVKLHISFDSKPATQECQHLKLRFSTTIKN